MTIPIKKQFKPTLFMSVSTGWAVRNFFQTGIVEKLKNEFKIVIFTLSHIKENLLKQGYGNDITFIILDDLKEPLMWRLFRQLKKKIYMECFFEMGRLRPRATASSFFLSVCFCTVFFSSVGCVV